MVDYAESLRIGRHLVDLLTRLASLGVPVTGASRNRIDYTESATPEQRGQGDAILATWDWNVDPVPESVFMFQLRKAMRRTDVVAEYPEGGTALAALETYAANAKDADLDDELSAASVRRDHGTVEKLRMLFRWTHAQVDDLFRYADTL